MVLKKKIRVLIVEDSKVNQGLLKGLLAEDPDFEVAGIAGNGFEAVSFLSTNRVDVVSMDIMMPGMDGVEATRQIMKTTPVPIVIVSSFYSPSEIKMSFSILEAGALTILPRPYGPGHLMFQQTARQYRSTLKMMSEVKVKPIRRYPAEANRKPVLLSVSASEYKIIAIGASAGGPQAIQVILKLLPSTIPVPVLFVQHIDPHFAQGYCEWLGSTSNLPIHIASDGDALLPGHVYMAPGDFHLGLKGPGTVAVTQTPPEKRLRPSVAFLFRSVLNFYGKNTIAILLSGMGADGAEELKALRDRGAFTIAQDAQSSLVHGMPGEAIRMGGASCILSPEAIVKEIDKLFQNQC